jgi:threonine synthase
MLVVSTASPYKFTPAVAKALGIPATDDEQECMNAVAAATGTTPLEPLTAVFTKEIRFTKVIDKADMAKDVLT